MALIFLREWRNWQTRYFEVVVRETFWGFESPLSHITTAIPFFNVPLPVPLPLPDPD